MSRVQVCFSSRRLSGTSN